MDLAGKLQLKAAPLCVLTAPKGFAWEGAVSKDPKSAKALLLFVKDSQELKAKAAPAVAAPRRDPIPSIACPKAGQRATDLTRDSLWAMLQGQGIQPVRGIAIDDTWSALRFRPAKE